MLGQSVGVPSPPACLILHCLAHSMRLGALQSVLTFLGQLVVVTHAKATIDQVILALERSNSTLIQYPTQITQNIVPKPIHSHNDCECCNLVVRRRRGVVASSRADYGDANTTM